jgi:3-methyladenine DNA glycosylase AlkD
MKVKEAMAELKAAGTEQNRKIYRRHGANGQLFGVSFGDLGRLQKRIRVDHALARQLWATGNVDARTLATMIADPKAATEAEIDGWMRDIDYYTLDDTFTQKLVARTPYARKKAKQWSAAKSEYKGRAGWHLVGQLTRDDPQLPDSYFAERIEQIEREIHGARNRKREAMNNALIAIGLRSPALQRRAIAAAKRIGPVDVDHGETNCKTPDAAAYIQKAAARTKRPTTTAR